MMLAMTAAMNACLYLAISAARALKKRKDSE